MQEPQEGSGGFVVAGGDAAELLEAVKHPLDAVAILVSLEVAGDRDGAIGPRRDNRQDAMEKQAVSSDNGAVDHMLPVVGQTEIDQRFQQGIPNALFCPTAEPNIDRIPLAVTLVHITPRTADSQHIKHAIDEAPVVMGWATTPPPLGRKQRSDDLPFLLSQIATHATGLRKDQC